MFLEMHVMSFFLPRAVKINQNNAQKIKEIKEIKEIEESAMRLYINLVGLTVSI
jgi:hypothetical protein